MGALGRLFELLWITDEHDCVSGLCDRHNIGERHLGGFVDEQHVDALESLRSGPEPSGPRSYLAIEIQRGEDICILAGNAQPIAVRLGVFGFLDALNFDADLVRDLTYAFDQVPNDLVAIRHDANLLPDAHQLT